MKCKQCGKEFKPKNNTNVYCNPQCRLNHFRDKLKQDRDYKNYNNIEVKTCKYCGLNFRTYDQRIIYCSRYCACLNRRVTNKFKGRYNVK